MALSISLLEILLILYMGTIVFVLLVIYFRNYAFVTPVYNCCKNFKSSPRYSFSLSDTFCLLSKFEMLSFCWSYFLLLFAKTQILSVRIVDFLLFLRISLNFYSLAWIVLIGPVTNFYGSLFTLIVLLYSCCQSLRFSYWKTFCIKFVLRRFHCRAEEKQTR